MCSILTLFVINIDLTGNLEYILIKIGVLNTSLWP